MFRVTWMVSAIFLKKWNHKLIKVNITPVLTLPFNWFDLWWDWQACKKIVYNFFHFGPSKLMCQIKLLGVVGGVLGRNTLLIFQQRFAGKSVFLINQFTFWNFSIANTIKCIFAFGFNTINRIAPLWTHDDTKNTFLSSVLWQHDKLYAHCIV